MGQFDKRRDVKAIRLADVHSSNPAGDLAAEVPLVARREDESPRCSIDWIVRADEAEVRKGEERWQISVICNEVGAYVVGAGQSISQPTERPRIRTKTVNLVSED